MPEDKSVPLQDSTTNSTAESTTSLKDEINKRLKQLTEHWTLLTFLAGLLSALLGLGTLMAFTRAIGRIDLLPMALEAKSSILPWIVIIVFLSLAYIAVLLITSFFYALALSMFSSTPNLQPQIAKLSVFPIIAGAAIFIGCIFHDPGWNKGIIALLISVVATGITIVTIKKKEFKLALEFVALFTHPEKAKSKRGSYGHLLGFICLLNMTIFSAIYIVTLLLKTYVGVDTPQAVNQLMIVSTIAVILNLAPAIVFFATKHNSLTRALRGLGTSIAVGLVIIAIAPGATSTIVYSAASIMGIRETTSSAFMLQESFGVEDFDTKIWGSVDKVREHPVIQAFPLFALADILLLCPAPLTSTKLADWPEKSNVCIVTKNSAVTRLPGLLTPIPDQPNVQTH